jgi:putative SOS response-associated peptidase YedK
VIYFFRNNSIFKREKEGIVINARLETAAEKPMFKKSFSAQRCLVPAGYYFEWQKDGAKKQKYAIKTKEPIYMAGLWQTSNTEPIPLFVILTRPASSELKFIHDRMPVILPKDAHGDWLCGRLSTKDLENIPSEHFICESM